MTRRTLILNSLRHHARTHLGTLLGAIVASAVLIGALVVGDSVRFSLRKQALNRLGDIHLAVVQHDRYFRAALADEIQLGENVQIAPILRLQASAFFKGHHKTTGRAPNVRLMGVDDRFWKIANPQGEPPKLKKTGTGSTDLVIDAMVNLETKERLKILKGDQFQVRIAKPSLLPRDVPLAVEGKADDMVVVLNLRLTGILKANSLGDFNLRPDPQPPFNIFIPLEILQELAGKPDANNPSLLIGMANMLIAATPDGNAPTDLLDTANSKLAKHWQLADAQLALREVETNATGGGKRSLVELFSPRVFMDENMIQAAEKAGSIVGDSQVIMAYMVNKIENRALPKKFVPYSIVAAVPHKGPDSRLDSPTNHPLAKGEMLINDWLRKNQKTKLGDEVDLTYYVLGNNREMKEESRTFKVVGIVPTEGPGGDRELMPHFPGVRELKSITELDKLGFTLDEELRRQITRNPENDKYWGRNFRGRVTGYKGTPKAFISIDDAKEMWDNRYGVATAVRFPGGEGVLKTVQSELRKHFNPSNIGLEFRDMRSFALEGNSASDFGGLFIGLSFFLVVAALILMGLLFVFGVEQRAAEVGTLLAIGFTGKQTRNLLLGEGAVLAVLGALLGALAGLGYTRAMIYGLSHQWVGAIGGRDVIQYHHEPTTVALGAGIGIVVAIFTIWLTVRRLRRAKAVELLASGAGQALSAEQTISGKRSCVIALLCLLGALGLSMTMADAQGMAKAGGFFGAGTLLLVGGLYLCRTLLMRLGTAAGESFASLGTLGLRGSARRRGRSLACVCLLACGVFMVIAIGAFKINPNENADAPESGTGGFAFYAESALPIPDDLNSTASKTFIKYYVHRDGFAGEIERFPESMVSLRIREGDDASCLNLNQAREPRLLGVDPNRIRTKGVSPRFTFASTMEIDGKSGWDLLSHDFGNGIVPAVVDQNTGLWALHVKTGDTLEYPSESGEPFKLKIVGMLAFSMLQGDVIISETALVEKFPSNSGYRAFLVDKRDGQKSTELEFVLTDGLKRFGFDMTTAKKRLSNFSEVQNTYITIFQALGGLALLLGSLGLGVVVLRNVLERRGELAVMQAIGFRKSALRWLVCSEHGLLLVLGLAVGVFAALLAVWPSLTTPGSQMPWSTLIWMLTGVLISGMIWTWLAATAALRGKLLPALRSE